MTAAGTAVSWRRQVIPGTARWPGRTALVAYDEWGDEIASWPCADFRTVGEAEAYVREREKPC